MASKYLKNYYEISLDSEATGFDNLVDLAWPDMTSVTVKPWWPDLTWPDLTSLHFLRPALSFISSDLTLATLNLLHLADPLVFWWPIWPTLIAISHSDLTVRPFILLTFFDPFWPLPWLHSCGDLSWPLTPLFDLIYASSSSESSWPHSTLLTGTLHLLYNSTFLFFIVTFLNLWCHMLSISCLMNTDLIYLTPPLLSFFP